MDARDLFEPIVDTIESLAAEEVEYWTAELGRPWRTGLPGRAASVGRWLGLGLAIGALAVGVGAALRSRKPR